ncbi:hypothetical protein ABFS83_08G113200 [Erythranthe nasuta]
MSSSMNKSYLMNNNNKNNISSSSEEAESGWTDYLDDFPYSKSINNGGSGGSSINSFGTPSLISDAAWNGSDDNNNNNNNNNISSPLRILNFKNLKRNKYRKYSYAEDDYEDTASSPVNSPKVSSMKQMEVNYRRLDDLATANFLGKQGGASNFSEVVTEEKNGNNNKNIANESKNNIDHQFVDLRTRGLCLMPISALMNMNYLG